MDGSGSTNGEVSFSDGGADDNEESPEEGAGEAAMRGDSTLAGTLGLAEFMTMSSLYLNLMFCSLGRFGRETLIVSPLSSLSLLGPFSLKRGLFVGGSADAVESTISADFLAWAIPRLVDSVYFFNLAVEIRSVK